MMEPKREEAFVSTKPPNISTNSISQLLWKYYSFDELDRSSVKQLNSWGDLNYYFECKNNGSLSKFVLKIIKENDPSNAPNVIRGMAEVMKFLSSKGYNCCVPINTLSGDPVLVVSESTLLPLDKLPTGKDSPAYSIMVLNYVEGQIAHIVHNSRERRILHEIGHYFGSMNKTLQEFNNEAIMKRKYLKFDLRHLSYLRVYLPIINNDDKRNMLTKIIDAYESQVVIKIPQLSQGVIHNDGNWKNIIISHETSRICGVIDFGDIIHSCHIFELAILTIEAFIHPFNIPSVRPLVQGYIEAFPLPDVDLNLLYYVVLGRLAQIYINGQIICLSNSDKCCRYISEELLPQVWSLTQFVLETSKIDFDNIIFK